MSRYVSTVGDLDWLLLLGIVSLLLQSLLAAINLLVDFKDKQGRVTRWGKRALVATVASTLVALMSFVLDQEQAERVEETQAEAAREQLEISQSALAAAVAQQQVTADVLRNTTTQLARTEALSRRTDTILSNTISHTADIARLLLRLGGDALFFLSWYNADAQEVSGNAGARELVQAVSVEFWRSGSTSADWTFESRSDGSSSELWSSSPGPGFEYDTSGIGGLAMHAQGVIPAIRHQFPSGKSVSLQDVSEGVFYVGVDGDFEESDCRGSQLVFRLVAGAFPIPMRMRKVEECRADHARWSLLASTVR